MTIRKKLMLISIGGIVPLAITTILSFLTLQQVDPEKSSLVAYSSAMANQMRADMMHDALRADLLGAMMAAPGSDLAEPKNNRQKHVVTIREMFKRNQDLPLSSSTHSVMKELLVKLEEYGSLVGEIVQLSATNRQEAEKRMPAQV